MYVRARASVRACMRVRACVSVCVCVCGGGGGGGGGELRSRDELFTNCLSL